MGTLHRAGLLGQLPTSVKSHTRHIHACNAGGGIGSGWSPICVICLRARPGKGGEYDYENARTQTGIGMIRFWPFKWGFECPADARTGPRGTRTTSRQYTIHPDWVLVYGFVKRPEAAQRGVNGDIDRQISEGLHGGVGPAGGCAGCPIWALSSLKQERYGRTTELT